MPSPAETGVRTLYRPDGSYSWAGDLDKIEEDRKALSCQICSDASEPKVLLVSTRKISEPVVKQIEAQAADKVPLEARIWLSSQK